MLQATSFLSFLRGLCIGTYLSSIRIHIPFGIIADKFKFRACFPSSSPVK